MLEPAQAILDALVMPPGLERSFEVGATVARGATCEVGMIARNCRPNLERNLEALERLSCHFARFAVRSYSNDCTDGTEAVLDSWRPMFPTTFDYEELGRPFLGGTRVAERTIALAEYRTRVQRMMEPAGFHLVLDPDMLLVDVRRLIAGLGDMVMGGYDVMAAQGLASVPRVIAGRMIHYDAFAWRPKWTWFQDDQRELSFHHDVRPAGCRPYRVNSAFGGACWYGGSYPHRVYDGGMGCEHVSFNRSVEGRVGISPNMSAVCFLQ